MKSYQLLGLATVVSAAALPARAQQAATIRGTVTTQDGAPAEAVTVGLKGRGQGAVTNAKGQFVIERVRDGEYVVVVSAVGLKTTEKPVTVRGGQTAAVDFVLSENAQQLREVVVSGARINKFARRESEYVGKMPLKNLENPQVYNSVGQELLTEQQVFKVDDAVRNVPGVQKMWEATGRSGDGGSYYNLRGFIVQSQLRNGLAGNVTSDIDAVNLERLEVIKGPSATLYGSALTSYGGLLNRVTKRPTEEFGGEVAVAGGSYGFHRVSADVNLVDGRTPADQARQLAFRLNAAYQYEDSFQDRGFSKTLAVAPSLTYRPTDRLTVNVDAELFQGRSQGRQMVFFYYPAAQLGATRADELPLDYRKSYTGGGLAQQSRSANFFARVDYRLAPGLTSSTNLTSSHSYSDGRGPYFYLVPDAVATGDSTAAPGAHYLARADQSTGNSTNQVVEVQQLFNADFRLGSMRNRAVLGLDLLRTNANQKFYGSVVDIVPLNVPGYDYSTFSGAALDKLYTASAPQFTYPVTTRQSTYSAFVSDVLSLTDKLSVLAALRLDRYENQGGLRGAEQEKTFRQTALSPKFGVVYQPVLDRVALFANYQNSFINRGTFQGALGGFVVAEPEQANQVEAGVKLDAAGGKLSGVVSYYDIRVRNVLRALPLAEQVVAGVTLQTQDGAQRSRGVEVSVVANPFAGLNAVAGFSYNDSRLTRTGDELEGRRPNTASSPYLANLWVSYRLPAGRLQGLGFGAGGNYASDNRIQNAPGNVFILPSYTVLNASAFYDQPRYRVSARVDNLTNERYWIGYTTMNPQKLRSVVGSVAYKF